MEASGKLGRWNVNVIGCIRGGTMEKISSVEDFKKFLEDNREKIQAEAVNADDITLDDEWMQDDVWDEIYKDKKSNVILEHMMVQ